MNNFSKKIENISNKNLTVFIDAVEEYVISPKTTERISDITKNVLNVYNKIPSVYCTSLFLINEDNFDFEHKATNPSEYSEESKNNFVFLVENGYLGTSLQTGKVIVTMDENYEETQIEHIIIPLVVSWGIIGLIIVTGKNYSGDLSNILLKLSAIMGNIFASNLERINVYQKLQNIKTELEQKVASRTMDLTQSKRELKAILDSIHTGIIVANIENGQIWRVNPKAGLLIGDNETNILKNNLSYYFEDYNIKEFGTSFESTLKTKNNEKIPILRSVTSLTLTSGKYIIESFVDISDRIKAEKALKEINEKLENKVSERTKDLEVLIEKLKNEVIERELAEKEAKRMLDKEIELSQMKSEFVSMVSHEFRTPLTLIKSATQLLDEYEDSLDNEEKKDYRKRIIKTVDYMTDLIENVIFIGKSDNELNKISVNKINIVDFTEQLISDILISEEINRQIITNYELKENIFYTDEKLLKLILINIISNAIKYSDKETKIEINLKTTYQNPDDFFVVFEIKDYGIGIPINDQEKIFDLFHRSNNVGNISGTGIGMSVVKQSLRILNGNINLESELNIGTTFFIEIPNQIL